MAKDYQSFKERLIFFAWVILLALSIITGIIAVEETENKRFQENQRRSVVEQLSTIRARMEGQLNAELLLARSIIMAVVTDSDITKDRFFKIAENFFEESKHIRNIGLAKGTVLTYVYPEEGNREAIGLDYTKNAKQWPAVKRVIEGHKTVVAGPLNLLQGGVGIIGRTPIFIDTSDSDIKEYFGILSVVINIPSLYEAAGLTDKDFPLKIAIRGKDDLGARGDVFYGSEDLFKGNSEKMEITLPGGSWLMAATPVNGWKTISPLIIYYRITALAIGLFVMALLFIQQREMNNRKKAEQELENSKKQLRLFIDSSPDMYFLKDKETKYLLVNTANVDFLGKGESDILGKTDFDLMPEEAAQRCSESDYRAIKDKKMIVTTEDVGERVYETRKIPVTSDDSVVGVAGIIRDITERKLAEDKLRESKQQFQELVENLNDVLFMTDTDAITTYVSPPIESLLGYTPEELIQTPFKPLIHPEDLGLLLNSFKNVLNGELSPTEFRIRHKNGEYHWVKSSSRPIYRKDVICGLQGVLTDITSRKETEIKLRESESKFRNLFELYPQAIALTDPGTGKLIDVNNGFCELTQYDKAEIIGKATTEVGFYSETDRSIFIHELQTGGAVNGLEMKFKAKDGANLIGLMFAHLIEIAGKPVLLTVFVDISAQKELESQLRHAQKMKAIGTLAGGIAHELNNMLTIMLGNTELAIDDIPEGNPAADYIQEIKTAGMRAKDVTRKLLNAAQKMPAARKQIYIQASVTEPLDLLRRTIPAMIDLKLDLRCSTEMIIGDPAEISQILINLCTNAVHAMSDQTGVIEVYLAPVKLDSQSAIRYEGLDPGDYARLTVRDSGAGIEPELIDRVFEPYFTTKDVDEGLGMGLAVVYGIVKNHEGSIKIESEVGKGTTVEVLFPLIEEQPVPGNEKTESLPTGTERILVVDDEQSLVKMLKRILTRLGYDVMGTTSSLEGLELFKAEPEKFDLVITDMAMPQMTGDQMALAMLKLRSNIPVILCTGHSDQMDEKKAMELGISSYYMKPYNIKGIAETIRQVLEAAKE